MTTFIALLRGINVGGNRMLSMPKLRELCIEAGLPDVRSYVNSGNLVFTAKGKAERQEEVIEAAIETHYGFKVDVIVRSAKDWAGYASGNPFPEASEQHPHLVSLLVPKQPLGDEVIAALRSKASGEERVEKVGEVVWIYYAQGAARSKIGVIPGRIPVTARNWRTVLKLQEMASANAR
jgi:uncharacterized protein (DUF1697 family)